MWFFIENLDSKLKFIISREERNGMEYFKIENVEISYDISSGEVDLPDWSPIFNYIINSSFGLLKDSIKPIIAEFLPKVFKEKLVIFNSNSINELFLE